MVPSVRWSSDALILVAIGDGIFASHAKGLGGQLGSGGGLAALVLSDIDEALNALDQRWLVAEGDNFGQGEFVFNDALENGVEHRIGRQAVLIGLVGAQFSAGRLVDDGLGNDFPGRPEAIAGDVGIAPAR